MPFSAGGPAAAIARLAAPPLSEAWGQQVVIDNRAGASGIMATELVAGAAADGYTLLCISSSFTINASLRTCCHLWSPGSTPTPRVQCSARTCANGSMPQGCSR